MKLMNSLAKHQAILSVIALLGVSMLMGAPVLAQSDATDTFGIVKFGDDSDLGTSDLRTTIARIINISLSLLGVLAVVIILAGGLKWITAGGNEDKVGEARKLIFAGVIGLAIILSAYAIARYVIGALGSATGTGNVLPEFQNQ